VRELTGLDWLRFLDTNVFGIIIIVVLTKLLIVSLKQWVRDGRWDVKINHGLLLVYLTGRSS